MRKMGVIALCALIASVLAAGGVLQAPLAESSLPFVVMAGDDMLPSLLVAGERPVPEGLQRSASPVQCFKTIISSLEDGHLPHIPIGRIISVTFRDGEAPIGGVMEEYIFTREGEVKFWTPTPQTIPVRWDGDTLTFTLAHNWLASASSNSEDYTPGAVYRGFTLRCEDENGPLEYAFALRADPPFIFGEGH